MNFFTNLNFNIMYQDSVTCQCDGILHLHNMLFCLLISIVVFVFLSIFSTYVEYRSIFFVKDFFNSFFFFNLFQTMYLKKNNKKNLKNIKGFPKYQKSIISFPCSKIKIKNRSESFLYTSLYLNVKRFIINNILNLPTNLTFFSQSMRNIEYISNYFIKIAHIYHGTVVETIWTILPSVILLFLAIPSFGLLYSLEESYDGAWTITIIGNQWFWYYEDSIPVEGEFYNQCTDNLISDGWNSYLISDSMLEVGQFRLLETDIPLILSTGIIYKFIISASDVLHCWTLPALGLKIDACPGRVNLGHIIIKHSSIIFGQCSEICGIGHGFMPITLFAVSDIFDTISFMFYRIGVN